MIRACTCTTVGPCEWCRPTGTTAVAVVKAYSYPPTPKPPRMNREQRRHAQRAARRKAAAR